MNLDELRNEKGVLITQMRALNDKAITAKKALEGDDAAKYNAMENDLDRITAQITRAEALEKADKENRSHRTTPIRAGLDNLDESGMPVRHNQGKEYNANFRAYLRGGDRNTPMEITASLTKGTGTQVGYLVPVEYETEIRKAVYPLTVMRQVATVDTSSSDSVIPMEGSLPVFGWIDELGTYPKTDLTVGRLGMGANKLGGILLASEEVLADAFTNLPVYIANRSKVSIAQTEDAAFTIGDGNKKPTGVAVSATLGVTAAAANVFTMDEVLDFMDSLPAGYTPNAKLMVSKRFRSQLRKLKDTQGRYLWEPGLQVGVPDQFDGKTVVINAYLSAPAAGQIPALYGDFSFYQILDRLGFYIQQLNELYAETGQIGFKVTERLDGKLLNTAAVVKMAMAAS